MPSPATLALFAATALALACTPGPDMLLIASRSVTQGRAAGFASLLGAQAGTYGHAAAAALGLSQLLAVPLAYDALRYASAAYLLALAWTAFRSKGPSPGLPPAAPLSLRAIFRQGLLTNLLNPKVALFVLALFPQFVRPEAGAVAVQILVLATVLNGTGLLANSAVILCASRLRVPMAIDASFATLAREAKAPSIEVPMAVGALSRAMARPGRFRRAPQIAPGTVFTALALRLAAEGGR